MKIHTRVNGMDMTSVVEPRLLLSDFLRHELSLTATHVGCETGVCGACNVLLDGAAVRSCLLFAAQVDGHAITTVEGLTEIGALRERFVAHRAFQCGFCTPGFLVSLAELESELEAASEQQVRAALVGNVCRCTGYTGIVEAASGPQR
jgi:aerobic carbon-monoxide dehydrogenase small subunit